MVNARSGVNSQLTVGWRRGIGALLGPPELGGRGKHSLIGEGLPREDRHKFRLMSEFMEVVRQKESVASISSGQNGNNCRFLNTAASGIFRGKAT